MEIDKMVEELLGLDIVKEDNTVVFSVEAKQLIHKIAEKCSSISFVNETKEQAEEYAKGLSVEQVYMDMLIKIMAASTRLHMRVLVRMLIPIIDKKLLCVGTEG